ncbi:tryptophan synthase subunit alpha [Marinobacterium sedimentorum]|uniref:tryptophan synthase subunit alpha n=1 Tax=Marinobacterium sedimentorum TaxID=2927804 RepID=UPI0020C72F7B|nr:tryptophan synthase subunit alpha [Marinobacterium sedimentorum]MCP8687187.1 tryptophan synthase subunit alpha [Marinobacterium sedimentorum]
MEDYVAAIRATKTLPLTTDFGINNCAQVQALHRHSDIAVIGSGLLDAYNRGGPAAVL